MIQHTCECHQQIWFSMPIKQGSALEPFSFTPPHYCNKGYTEVVVTYTVKYLCLSIHYIPKACPFTCVSCSTAGIQVLLHLCPSKFLMHMIMKHNWGRSWLPREIILYLQIQEAQCLRERERGVPRDVRAVIPIHLLNFSLVQLTERST